MKVNKQFFATAKDGNSQKFNAYPKRHNGVVYAYQTRFYVDNYIGRNGIEKTQWTGKGCSHKTQADAIAFGYKIASAVMKAQDFDSVKYVIEINSAYNKVFK